MKAAVWVVAYPSIFLSPHVCQHLSFAVPFRIAQHMRIELLGGLRGDGWWPLREPSESYKT